MSINFQNRSRTRLLRIRMASNITYILQINLIWWYRFHIIIILNYSVKFIALYYCFYFFVVVYQTFERVLETCILFWRNDHADIVNVFELGAKLDDDTFTEEKLTIFRLNNSLHHIFSIKNLLGNQQLTRNSNKKLIFIFQNLNMMYFNSFYFQLVININADLC